MNNLKQKLKYHLSLLIPFISFKRIDDDVWKYKADGKTETSKLTQIAKPMFNMIYSVGLAGALIVYAGESNVHEALNVFEWNKIATEKKQERINFKQNITTKLFDQIDTNNDKLITLEELSKGIDKAYLKRKDNRCYDIYQTLNDDFFLKENYVNKKWSK